MVPFHFFEDALLTTLNARLVGAPSNLAASIRYSLTAPGKRIRPRLLTTCGSLLGLKREATLPAAIAIEMIHCFSLIHDDLPCMDNDDFRRGIPSNHKKFNEGLALLAGDTLIPMAYETFLETAQFCKPQHVLEAFQLLLQATGAQGLCGGQARESLLTPDSSLEDLRLMHQGKTGALFEAALNIPRALAGISADSDQGRAIAQFAQELGLAFQVADDLQDGAQDHKKLPTSVLFYLPKEDCIHLTTERLARAERSLESVLGKNTEVLLAISGEVKSALHSS